MFSLTACVPGMLAPSFHRADSAPARRPLGATSAVTAAFGPAELDGSRPLVDTGLAADEGPIV
jgi:hypothetical protein